MSFLCLTERAPSLYNNLSASAIFQQTPSSSTNHHRSIHLLEFWELEEEDRLEKGKEDFIKENRLVKSAFEDFTHFITPFFAEKQTLSISAPPIYLVDEQFRL